jgi:hypothetical protein
MQDVLKMISSLLCYFDINIITEILMYTINPRIMYNIRYINEPGCIGGDGYDLINYCLDSLYSNNIKESIGDYRQGYLQLPFTYLTYRNEDRSCCSGFSHIIIKPTAEQIKSTKECRDYNVSIHGVADFYSIQICEFELCEYFEYFEEEMLCLYKDYIRNDNKCICITCDTTLKKKKNADRPLKLLCKECRYIKYLEIKNRQKKNSTALLN